MRNDGTLTVEKVERSPGPELQAWLAERREGIGGSDVAAVLGLSPWKSALALWAEKCGPVDQPNLDEIEYIEWGKILEEPIARRYVRETGRTLIDHGRFNIQFTPLHPCMHCTIDREIMPADGLMSGPGDLSIKNAGEFKLKDWEEEPPLPYQVQLQHELCVTGMQWGSFAVLIGGNKFRWMDVPRNDKFIRYLIEKEEEFWDLVRRGDPPAADASDSTKEILLRLYPKDTGESKALPVEASDWAEQIRAAKAEIKRAEGLKQEFENKIKAAIGEANIGILPDGSGFSWKSQHRDSYVVAASDFRVLREIKGGK